MNAKDLIDRARRHLLDMGAPGNQEWGDDRILQAINEEQDDLVSEVLESSEDWYGTVKDINLRAGEAVYDLFDGFLKLILVEFGGSGTNSSSPYYYQGIESR